MFNLTVTVVFINITYVCNILQNCSSMMKHELLLNIYHLKKFHFPWFKSIIFRVGRKSKEREKKGDNRSIWRTGSSTWYVFIQGPRTIVPLKISAGEWNYGAYNSWISTELIVKLYKCICQSCLEIVFYISSTKYSYLCIVLYWNKTNAVFSEYKIFTMYRAIILFFIVY